MNKILLSFTLLFLSFTAFAQRDYKPGYILQNGDTIRGYVSQKNVVKSSDKVIFKSSPEGAAVVYTPYTIGGYGVSDGDLFETKQIGAGDSVLYRFLKILVSGHTSLYSFKGDNPRVTYFLTKKGTLHELVQNTVTEVLPNGQKVAKKYDLYKGVLQELTTDCPELATDGKKLEYNQKSLSEFVVNYNNCQSPNNVRYVAHPAKAEFSWGLLIGGGSTTLEVSGTIPEEFNKKYNSSFSPMAALQVSSTLPWVSKKLSVQLEGHYNRMHFTDNLSASQGIRRYEYDLNIDLHYLKLPLLLRYTIPIGKVEPYFNVGVAYSFAFKHKQDVTLTTTFPSGTTMESRYFMQKYDPRENNEGYSESFRNYSQSLLFGTGVKIPVWAKHSISFEARYEMSNGFSELVNTNTNVRQIYFLAGFTF